MMEEQILESFKILVFRKGIKSISIDELAQEMRVSKKTIYQYFKSKEDLVNNLLKKHLKTHQQIIEKIHNESEDMIQEILLIMQCSTHMLTQINPIVFEDLKIHYKKIWHNFEQFKKEYVIDRLMKTLEKGQKQGLIRKNIPLELMAHLRLKEIELLMDYNFVKTFKMSMQEMQQSITEYFILGVCTQKGIDKMYEYLKHPEKIKFNLNC